MSLPFPKFVPNLKIGIRDSTPANPANPANRASIRRPKPVGLAGLAGLAAHLSHSQENDDLEMFDVIAVIGEPDFWPFDLWINLEERSAILEFDAGYSRAEAERLARIELNIPAKGDLK